MTDTNQEVRETPEALTFTYTNWRGETAERRIRAKGAFFRYAATEWHPEPQWLLSAIDFDKMEGREFALRDIVFASAPPPAVPDAVGVWEQLKLAALSSIETTPSSEPQAVLDRHQAMYDDWLTAALARPADEQFNAATALAANVGCVLVNEPDHPDAPGFGGFERAAEAAFARSGGDTAVVTAEDYRASPEPQVSNVDDDEFARPHGAISDALYALGAAYVVDEGRWYHPAHRPQWLTEPDAQYLGWLQGYAAAEPQASNAGAVEALRAAGWMVAVHNDYRLNGEAHTFWLWTKGDRAVKGEGRTDAEALEIVTRAALSTPEPQTGERDKAIHDIAEAIGLGRNMCDDDGGGSTDLDVFRQAFFALDAVEQMLLAERTAREAAEARVREQQQAMEEDDGMVAEQVTRAEAAESRLAEVEERAKEDERDRLLNATDHVNTPPYRVALRLFLREHGAMEPADRAALRAKPEAQAIGGKEAGE